MSFSHELKCEIIENKPMRTRCRAAQAYGLFLFGRAFCEQEVALHTENEETARLFGQFVRQLIGREIVVKLEERQRNGKTVYRVSLPEEADRLLLLACFSQTKGIGRGVMPTQEHIGAFLAGAFLACGNIIDPEKGYHMEFVVRDEQTAADLANLLDEIIPGARKGSRRRQTTIYYKECGPIEDLLTLMGATRSCLAIIDVETVKSVRNKANRAVNCETANIDKLVGAATAQIEDIRLLLKAKGEDGLPDSLRLVAKLRLDNPEASLRELAELSPVAISRSGIHHRLDKLSKMAAELRGMKGREEA